MTTLFNFQFPESHKILFCWDADVRPKSEIHPISNSRILNFQSHKIWSKQEISPHPRFSSIQVNDYTFENKTVICGTTSVPVGCLHKIPETPARGLRGQT